MEFQPILDWLVAVLVLVIVFFLGYASIRQRNLTEIVEEIKELIKGKSEQVADGVNLKYA